MLQAPARFIEEEDDPTSAVSTRPTAGLATKGNSRTPAASAARIASHQPAVGKKRGAAGPTGSTAVGRGPRQKKQRFVGGSRSSKAVDDGDSGAENGMFDEWQDDNEDSQEMNDFIVQVCTAVYSWCVSWCFPLYSKFGACGLPHSCAVTSSIVSAAPISNPLHAHIHMCYITKMLEVVMPLLQNLQPACMPVPLTKHVCC